MSTIGKEYKLAIRIAGIIDKSFNVSLGTANKSLKGFVRSVDNTFTQMDKYGNAAFRALTTAATVAATAVGAVEVAAVKVGSEFEAQMSAVQSIAQASTDDLGRLSDRARELAETSVFSATEAGQAMEYMGLAGWKTEQMLDGIEGVLNLAAASGEDLATVSDIVTDDLTAFNMTAEETQRMVDVMAQTAMNSNTTVEMMGEAFKYAGSVAGTMNYQIEDLGIAIGTIASQGIKSSMAGTALRNMITRMVKPTKESQEAMDALGLSLRNDEGELYSFLEIMQKLREGMKNYDVDMQNYYAAELGGQRGMAAIAAIANADEDAFNRLTEAIYHANGAAEEMAAVRLDNLKGDVQILKDTVNDLGIELYENESGPLRSIVQTATKFLQGVKSNLPAIGRSIGKVAGTAFDKLMGAGEWIVDNGDNIIGVLSGIAAAILVFKGMSTASHIVTGLMSIISLPYGPAILAITALAGAITAVVVRKKEFDREMVNSSLERHFGDIALSLSELQTVARGLVEDQSLLKIEYALKEYEKLDGIADGIEETAEALQKFNWKTEIGLGLTEDENEDYKRYIDSYIKDTQDYVTQAQYAANLNLSEYLGEDSETLKKVNDFFDNSREELTSKATELNEYVNEAFTDNLLTPDEAQTIAEYQEAMKDIMDKLATSELNASTTLIRAKYGSMADLDSESFTALQEELNEQLEKYAETQEESYKAAYAVAEAAGASQNELNEIAFNYLNKISAKQAELTSIMTNTVADAYGISESFEDMNDIIGNMISADEITQVVKDGASINWDAIFASINEEAASAMNNNSYDMEALGKLLEQMEPQEEQLEELAQKYREAGEGIPANILEGIQQYQQLELMSGDTSDIWAYFGSVLAESPAYEELLEYIKTNGEGVPEELKQAIEDNLNKVDPAVTDMYNETQTALNNEFSQGFDVNTTVRVNADVVISGGLTQVPNYQQYFDHNATGGIITSPEISWLAEKGPEAVVPLDGSRNAVSLWEKAGQLLGMGSILDRYDISGGTQNSSIEYKPTLQFYGEAPSRSDLDEALAVSQDKFDEMMERYLKTNGRVSFA